jgi:hypothetical protein
MITITVFVFNYSPPGGAFPPREYMVMRARPGFPIAVLLLATALLASACSSSSSSSAAGGSPSANGQAAASSVTITAIGAENEYADVISQVGGR